MLRKLIEEGKFAYIGMSEVGSATLRKARAVSTLVNQVLRSLIPHGYGSTLSRLRRSNSVLGHTRMKRRKVCR